MAKDIAPCPYCGELIEVSFPRGRLKGIEKNPRVFLDFNEARVERSCSECECSFWVYYYEN